MLLALAFSAAVSLSIDCNVIDEKAFAEKKENAHVQFDSWPAATCAELGREYQNVNFALLRRVQSGSTREIAANEPGSVSVGSIRAGRMNVVWRSRRDNTTMTFSTKVTCEQEVWVFKKSLNPMSEIKSGHIKKQLANVSRVLGVQELVLDKPLGQLTRKRTMKGQVITQNLVSEKPLVMKNDNVVVRLSNNGLTIRTRGRALNHGWQLGETVRVRVHKGESPVTAKVIGEKLVNVEI